MRRLGEAAAGIAAFAAGAEAAAEGELRAVRVSESARASAALPLARSATAELVSLLAPWLETLFPAGLAERGVSGEQRVGANRAPLLHALLEDVQRSIGARPFAAFLADRGGCAVAVENTEPPSIVLGSALGGPLPPSVRRFVVARALSLCQLGWALLGKFAPRDIAILAELACRFAGAVPPPMGLPQGRAGPFLAALERSVPAPARERAAPIAAAAANELAALDPRELAMEVRRTAARVALLHVGDVHAGLSALQAGDRRLAELPARQALARPDLLDLALFAISDDFMTWRAAAEGA